MTILEIERKYLLPDDFDFESLDSYEHGVIAQWYLPDYLGMSVRLSSMVLFDYDYTDTYYLSVKSKEEELVRKEINARISYRAFKDWFEWQGLSDTLPQIQKERKRFSHNALTWEVDKFHLPVKFCMAEVEIEEDLIDYDIVIPPQLAGAIEVTGQPEYYNRNMK